MPLYRNGLPQLDGSLYLTDAGLETDLIFNHGIEIREFAAHTLLPDPAGRAAVARYFDGFLGIDPLVAPGYESLRCTVRLSGDGTPEQFREIHETVMRTSPNRFNLARPVPIEAELVVG